MILEHYGTETLEWPPRQYDQKDSPYRNFKPWGLWVSVKGKDDWPWWCEAENFRLDQLAIRTIVHLAKDANIKLITSGPEIEAFTAEYGYDVLEGKGGNYPLRGKIEHIQIDWQRVAKEYDGIIIAPYLWSHRLAWRQEDGENVHRVSNWYYGWDCASGCIWNAKAIARFEEMEDDANEVARRTGGGHGSGESQPTGEGESVAASA